MRDKPQVFLGSSDERSPLMTRVERVLAPIADPVPWNKAFRVGGETLHELVNTFLAVDFAVLILSPEDWVISRGKLHIAPRDNIIFEIGMAVGALGPYRSFGIVELSDRSSEQSPKLPSDLAGVTMLYYRPQARRPPYSFAAVCSTICETIQQLGLRAPAISLSQDSHERWLIKRLLQHHYKPTRITDEKFLTELIARVKRMKKGESLRAVCANKDWEERPLQVYLEANEQAATGGATIRRVFLEPRGGFSAQTKKTIAWHRGKGMEAIKICGADAQKLFKRWWMPEDFGFAVFSDAVYVHRGLNEGGAAVFREKWAIAAYQELFDLMAPSVVVARQPQEARRRRATAYRGVRSLARQRTGPHPHRKTRAGK
ncbi:MAG: TIR domain-containing protein [Thermoanaerobaculia bacterium]